MGRSLGSSGDRSYVELNMRLVDAATGRILVSLNAEGLGFLFGNIDKLYTKSGMSFGGNKFRSWLLGKVWERAIQAAVGQIAMRWTHRAGPRRRSAAFSECFENDGRHINV